MSVYCYLLSVLQAENDLYWIGLTVIGSLLISVYSYQRRKRVKTNTCLKT